MPISSARSQAVTRWRSLALAVLAIALPTIGQARSMATAGGHTTLVLHRHLLEDLGVTLTPDTPEMRFPIFDATVSALVVEANGEAFRSFASGALRHRGSLELSGQWGRVSLLDFEIRPGWAPLTLTLWSADGIAAFDLDHPHPELRGDPLELSVRNLDLRLAAPLAEVIGRPELAGLALGRAEITAPVVDGGQPGSAGAACAPDYSGTVDVQLESISSVSEIYHDAATVALAPAVTLLNVGTADVQWKRAIVPDGAEPTGDPAIVGAHPFLVMHLYRFADGRVRQIGRSDVKHAFFSANTGPCGCQPDQVLFVDCTDLYGANTNAWRKLLAPRDEVEANTASWTRLGSHFDGDPADDVRNHQSADHSDPFEHRLRVPAAELTTPGGSYFVEAWYLVAGDVDIFNSMGHRQVAPTLASLWSFPFVNAELRRGSILDRWVDPAAPAAGEANVVLDTGEGTLQLALRVTALAGGVHHYEYALMNFDFDRQVRSLRVPLPAGVLAQNLGFADVDGEAGNDWAATKAAGEIVWQAPAGNALDWGTLFNFRFDANAAPAARQATLGYLEAGAPAESAIDTLGPGVTPSSAVEITVALGGAGGGRVASDPAAIDCGSDCGELVAPGSVLTLVAEPASGAAFERWEESGAPAGRQLARSVTVSSSRVLTAVFEPCAEQVDVPAQTAGGELLFSACNQLRALDGFTVGATGGDVIFRAGQAIVIGNQFVIESGTRFLAELVPSQGI